MAMLATSADPQLITVHFYGTLAQKFGDKLELAVRSVAEVVRLMEANFPGFCKLIKHGQYYVMRGGKKWDEGESLGEEQIGVGLSGQDVHIVPTVYGAGSQKGGIFQIVLGVVLIGAAFVLSGGLAAPGIMAGFSAMGGTIWGTVAAVGAAMAVGGIVQLISPQAKTEVSTPLDKDNRSSTLFGGPINAGNQGVCMPVVYGRAICGSVVISASIHVTEANIATSAEGSSGSALGAMIGSEALGSAIWKGLEA